MTARPQDNEQNKKEETGRLSRACFSGRTLLCFSWLFISSSSLCAAAPTLTYLFPAGAQLGKTVEVTAGGTFERWPVRAWVDGKGLEIKAAPEKGKLTVAVAADAMPGTYWLRLFDEEGATALRPFLVGNFPEVLEQEPNDDARKPQNLDRNPVTVNGRLEKSGDVDCFALKLNKGQTLVASLEAYRTLGSPMDGVLQVLSADGFVLEHNNDFHGLDPQIVFPVPRDGTYVVRVFAFPSTPDTSIHFAGGPTYVYRLTLTTEGFADHAFPLAVGRSDPGQVELKGWNIPEAARKLTVPRADGSPNVLCPSAFGAVPLRLEPHPAIIQGKPNDRDHPQAIVLPVTISGCLEGRGDRHFYQFAARKGQPIQFQAEAQTLGFPLNPVLRLTDAAGKSLAQAEGTAPGRDPDLVFQAPKDGTYQMELTDLHGDGGPRFLYLLRVVYPEPDFALTLAADRFVSPPGKPLEIPITLVRRNGFDRPIDIQVEGLPAGVTATPTLLAAGAGSATLRLTGSTTPVSASIRILGKARGKGDLMRVADAALTELNASTTHIWVTMLRSRAPQEKK
jgi:hypothetical protein